MHDDKRARDDQASQVGPASGSGAFEKRTEMLTNLLVALVYLGISFFLNQDV